MAQGRRHQQGHAGIMLWRREHHDAGPATGLRARRISSRPRRGSGKNMRPSLQTAASKLSQAPQGPLHPPRASRWLRCHAGGRSPRQRQDVRREVGRQHRAEGADTFGDVEGLVARAGRHVEHSEAGLEVGSSSSRSVEARSHARMRGVLSFHPVAQRSHCSRVALLKAMGSDAGTAVIGLLLEVAPARQVGVGRQPTLVLASVLFSGPPAP